MRDLFLKAFVASVLLALSYSVHGEAPNEAKEREARAAQRNADLRRQAAEVLQQRQYIADQLAATRQKVREQPGLVEVTPEAIRHTIGRLQEQREQLELDAAGAEGRRKGLEHSIARLSKELKEREARQSSAVADELAAVVQTRQAQLERIKALHEKGAGSADEVESAQANLA